MPRPQCRSLRLLFICAMAAGFAVAQHPPGTITGSVDNTLHQVLPGASITLEPAHLTATSDSQGHFSFLRVPPGAYTVTVSYVGYQAQSHRAVITPGRTASIDFDLKVPERSQTVVVSAPRPYGVAEAINSERTSDNILNVLPATVINSLPNANIADAVGRLPGVTLERDEGEGKYVQIRGTEPRLSNLTIDGVDVPAPESGIRQVKLDVIPADLVGAVQINKTLQPSQDGDAIGGSVNLVTRIAGNSPNISLYTNGGITPIDNTRHVAEVGGTAGQRFGARKQFGAILSGSYDYNGRGIDDVEPVPTILAGTTFTPGFAAADMRQYLYGRDRYGFAGSTDYRISENSTIYLRGLFSDFKDYGNRTVYSLATNDGVPGPNVPSASTEKRIGDFLISSLALGGNHATPNADAWLNWQVSAARSRMLNPLNGGEAIVRFNYNGATSNCQFNPAATTDPYKPQFTPACFTEAYNPANFSLAQIGLSGHGLSEKLNLAAKVDTSKSYEAGSAFGTLQFGAKIQNSHQFDNSYEIDYGPANDASGNPLVIPMSNFVNGYHNSNYYGGAYPAGPFVDYGKVNSYFQANPNQFTIVNNTQGGNSNNFDLVERITSAYVMNALDYAKVRITGGVRMEETTVNTLSFNGVTNTLSVKGGASYVNFLPDLAVEYKLDNSSNLRFVYGRGLSRPIPYDMTSAVSFDPSTTPATYNIGNPALKPEFGNDFDVLYERYLTPLGMIRAGYFYKSLSDPIVQLQSTPATGPYAGYRVSQPANAGSAHVSGVEVAFEQQFTYFPGLLRGLGLSGNYSYTTSQAKDVAPGVRSDSPALLRQAPSTWNLSPTYDLGRFSGRVGMAYNGANIFQYNYALNPDGTPPAGGITGPSGDVYLYSHFQVDAQFSVRLNHGISLLVSGLNLNNAPFGFYQGSPQFPIQREFYKPTYTLGIRWNLSHE